MRIKYFRTKLTLLGDLRSRSQILCVCGTQRLSFSAHQRWILQKWTNFKEALLEMKSL